MIKYKQLNVQIPALAILLFICISAVSCKKKNTKSNGDNTAIINSAITISTSETFQTIQGFGCATVFRPSNAPLTNDELDRLFGTGIGQLGLNILRIRLATDDYWRSLELSNAKGAIQRGAKVLATPWSPPANFKTNNNLIGGSLIADSGIAYANYLNNFASYMSANGAPIYAVSVQNEPDWDPSYESCTWSALQMRDFLKNHGHLITNTRLMAPELVNNNQNYINTILGDNIAAANVDILGTHIYGGGIVENALAKSLNKEIWMTEHLDTIATYSASLGTAVEIHNCLTKANFSAYIWWYAKRFYGPIGEEGFVTKRGFFMSQFAKYIPSGSIRIGVSVNTVPEVRVSAFKSSTGKKIIVAINSYNAIVNQSFIVKDAVITELIPYTTTETTNAAAGMKIVASGNSFNYNLPPYSVTTFVEQ